MAHVKFSKQDEMGYVYVVKFENGMIKVGMSLDPEGRVSSHSKTAGRVSKIVDYWISKPSAHYRVIEKTIINKFYGFGKGEFKSGLSYTEVVEFAESIHELDEDGIRSNISISPEKFLQSAPLDGYSVRLTAWHARNARKLGNGNMADGIRKAIEKCIEAEKLRGG